MTFSFEIDDELMGVFRNEVTTLMASLNTEVNKLKDTHVMSYDLMRAFHTLGSVSALAGSKQLSDLSYASESLVMPFVDQSKIDPDTIIKDPDQDTILMCIRIRDLMAETFPLLFETSAHPDISSFIEEVKNASLVRSSHLQTKSVDIVIDPPMETQDDADQEILPTVMMEDDIVENSAFVTPTIALVDAMHDAEVKAVEDDIDPELFSIFYEEVQGLLDELATGIHDYELNQDNLDALKSMKRALHTIKGGARMGGALKAGMLFHLTESGIDDAIATGGLSMEAFSEARVRVAKGAILLKHNFQEFIGKQAMINVDELVTTFQEAPVFTKTAEESAVDTNGFVFETKFSKEAVKLFNTISDSSIRVSQKSLDTMLSISGENTILRSRMDSLVSGVLENTPQLSVSFDRLRRIIREIEIQGELMINSGTHSASPVQITADNIETVMTTEFLLGEGGEMQTSFDPLQLDRFTKLQEYMRMASESINDLEVMYNGLSQDIGKAKLLLDRFDIHGSDMHSLLTSAQMIGVDTMVGRFRKTITQAAKETGKNVKMDMSGDGRVDRQALDKISGAVDHILRNGVAHGIESPEKRLEAGKPEEGRISIVTSMDGDEVLIEIVDDGAGINKAKVREKAEAKGLIDPGVELTDEDVINLIFASGFSTADAVSTIAGRGVGLDAVKKDIESMGGFVRVYSEEGKGSRFVLRVRSTIATIPVLPMKEGDFWYAIPASSVSKVVQQKPDSDKRHITVDNHTYVLANINGELLEVADSSKDIRCVLIRDSNVAVRVETLTQGRELIMKKLGKQSESLPGVIGASVMDDGSTALIVNPARIVSLAKVREARKIGTSVVERPLKVLVVDDSLTVRKASQRFLDREGFNVMLAVDGQDAFEKMDNFMPDIVLSDIEMPRMDGFELTKAIRASVRYSEVPIIMISSRSIDTHINHAKSIGANAYFGKPYIETDLLAKIKELTKDAKLEAA